MNHASSIQVHPAVAAALDSGRPVVALESTLIAHGLPWPLNLQTARAAEAAVREEGAVPATMGVWGGRLRIGLTAEGVEDLARGDVFLRPSRRDWAYAVVQGR